VFFIHELAFAPSLCLVMLPRSVLALLFALFLLALQASSQSVTPSVTGSVTGSVSGSGSTSGSGSNSNSGSNSRSGSSSASNSGSNSASGSTSNTNSGSTSPSNTVTPPPAVINVQNLCKNHSQNICPSWQDPPGFNYVSFIVKFTPQTCANPPCPTNTTTTIKTSGRISHLTPSTTYTFVIQGVTAGGLISLPATAIFTTAPPNIDISNIVCVEGTNSATHRKVINCNWTAASPTLRELNIKWRCVSPIREPDSNKIKLFPNEAGNRNSGITSIQLEVNRDVTTCTVSFHAYFKAHPATRHVLTVIFE